MNRKLIWALVLALLVAGLGGCQLAKEEMESNDDYVYRDKHVGVYITFEPLNVSGPVPAIAKLAFDGTFESTIFEFPGYPGFSFFYPLIKGTNEFDDYLTLVASPEIMDTANELSFLDEGQEITLRGSIYLLESSTLYVNLVYQTETGDVYMLPAEMGIRCSNYITTQTVKESVTTSTSREGNQEENSQKYLCTVELNTVVVETPQDVIFKEMSAEDEVIKTVTITPDAIPEHLYWSPDCAYILVITRSGDRGQEVQRSILDLEEEVFYVYRLAGENRCLVGQMIALLPAN